LLPGLGYLVPAIDYLNGWERQALGNATSVARAWMLRFVVPVCRHTAYHGGDGHPRTWEWCARCRPGWWDDGV